jgi:senataxin
MKPNLNDTPTANLVDDRCPKTQVTGAKRPNEESSSSGKLENDKRPIQPPMKRPKKAPNIFIPKNKKS